jgi:hypothetical protein
MNKFSSYHFFSPFELFSPVSTFVMPELVNFDSLNCSCRLGLLRYSFYFLASSSRRAWLFVFLAETRLLALVSIFWVYLA